MKEWDFLSELGQRIKQDTTGAWARVQAYYQQIGKTSFIDDIDSLDGLTAFDDDDYGITLQDFTYSTPDVVPMPVEASIRIYQNDGDTEIQEYFEFTKTMEESFTFGFTEGLKVGTKATAKVGLPLVGESEIALSAEVMFQSDQYWTQTETKGWALKTVVPVSAHSMVKITGFINNAKINATFSGVAKATKGSVLTWFKLKGHGYTEAVVPLVILLPEDKRTVPLSGSFQGIEGISAYTHVEKVIRA
ncbi:MAG: ETX/MTX2 family pore-forming toxin [Candidatus Electronema sp. V4]|uniref:ETX/MTX2 family pore-forming toxin n=1 Tax=Candidatus Electronema sp. V4 TaxID=3454756 RepID=UPI0040558E5A